MANAILYISFKLKKGASVPDFLAAAERLNDEHISKQKGYISWKQLCDDRGRWADMCTFETLEDAKAFEANSKKNPTPLVAKEFYSFINLFTCRMRFYTVEKEY